MLIGEGPGKEEDLTGRPFVGRAGRLLDSALAMAGLPRESVFISNAVKCRPPKNRVPSREETDTCKNTYLLRQIELVNPRIVVLLGRTACRSLLNVDTLGQARGKAITKGNVSYFCTFHPAAVLRNPRLKATLVTDLSQVRRLSAT